MTDQPINQLYPVTLTTLTEPCGNYRRLFLVVSLLTSGIALCQAQSVDPRLANASDLAKYDKNRNGVLDADELAAKQNAEADQMRNRPIRTDAVPAADAGEAAIQKLSPFVVN